MPEIQKLNLLNHFIGRDDIPVSDKILLIYEKILEEVKHILKFLINKQQMNESCEKHLDIAKLDATNTVLDAKVKECKLI